ncbi:non-ribosomal peptide synthetase [Streptomyces winkii]|uniref:non-ribosomal peptide synthetase n=1 Tax=Streptomyces winkii TaxID=3051178 RepID=UPI0028D5CC50|nr:non-ribosomal peptide synthetase [Streptomyces sp. DSM 40971]
MNGTANGTAKGPDRAAGTGTGTGTAEVLAAVAGAVYHRSRQERIAVGCVAEAEGERREGVAVLDVDESETFSGLLEQAEKALVALGAEADPEGGAPEPAIWFSAVSQDGGSVQAAPAGRPLVEVRPGPRIEVAAGDDPDWGAGEDELFAGTVRSVLQAGRKDPDALVASTAPLTGAEGTTGFWGTGRAPREAVRLEEIIDAHAASDPDAPAVSCGGRTLTRGELDEHATALAARLQARGAGPGSVIAVLMNRSAELIVSLLAVLKCGGAYLALNPDDPTPRHAGLARDAGVELVVADGDLKGLVPEGLAVVDPAGGSEGGPAFTPPSGLTPEHLAYVCYTSGSTGEPKGVAVPHRAVSRLVRGTDWVDIRDEDVFLHLSPVSFDAATFEIFGALVNGCRLAVLPAGRVEMDELAATVREEQVSVLLLPTGLLHTTIASRIDVFDGVRHVLTGGDVASAPHVRQLFEAHPDVLYTNGYGPTENTTYTTCWTTPVPPAGPSVSIGGPVSGTSVAILDGEGDPVPAGVVGELYTAGEGLAWGYLGRPAATAERFVPHPSPRVPGERMYRTGDLARRRADGGVEFVGRADQQVKVQGFRVELGAVEEALVRCPEVSVAAVAAQQDESTRKRLIAYVVPADPRDLVDPAAGGPGLGARLRERLGAELPGYMVPWAIQIRPELTLNRNGKVDRRALPAVSRAPRDVWNEYVAPVTALERDLAELWGRVLGIEPVGVEDDFFDLGGHSLMAAGLITTIQSELGVAVSARTLYLQPTVAELAAAIEQTATTGH